MTLLDIIYLLTISLSCMQDEYIGNFNVPIKLKITMMNFVLKYRNIAHLEVILIILNSILSWMI